MSNLDAPMNGLESAIKVLQVRWTGTAALWNDSVSRTFESQYVRPIKDATQATLREMHVLAQIIADARRQMK